MEQSNDFLNLEPASFNESMIAITRKREKERERERERDVPEIPHSQFD